MHILIACESSGTVREAFRSLGHDATSCDIQPADDGSPHHIRGDALDAIASRRWDMVIAHPPCTHLASSGAAHFAAKRADGRQQAGIDFFMSMVRACETHANAWAIENPIGIMSRLYRKPDHIIQPWQFGDDASKATCLWTRNLPPLMPTHIIAGRLVNGRMRYANQCDSGQNRLAPSADRWKLRSKTYAGIAAAMAAQWGCNLHGE